LDTLALDRTLAAGLRDQAFLELRANLPAANFEAALRCAGRLLGDLPHRDQLERNLILVAFGGGKDSAYTLTFVRTMQLILHRLHGSTFRMRVVTMRHAGMPRAVMENIDRVYAALRLPADPDCELLLVDGNEVRTFDVDLPQRDSVIAANRLDILMAGHRTGADGRPTFCNACNFSVANAFGLAASHGDGADLIITGDSAREQRQYSMWIGRLSRQVAPGPQPRQRSHIARVLSQVDRIGERYFADIHGSSDSQTLEERRVNSAIPERTRFFSIYADTAYEAGDHLDLLTGFLGFHFDDIAFSFTESDCGNPTLMAHLRALKVEYVYGRTYAEGLAEYVSFALELMRRKEIPERLIAQMADRYTDPGQMRKVAAAYAWDTFELTQENLVCMAYAPFVNAGAGLEHYLDREQPGLPARSAHEVLAGYDEPFVTYELERMAGLPLERLRILYGRSGRDVIDAVLTDDPHKTVISTRHGPDGPDTLEQISGR
jgi:hypothetical protein